MSKGRRLLWDVNGDFSSAPVAPRPEQPVSWLFDERDIVVGIDGSGIEEPFIMPAPEAWTEIEIKGTKQITAPPGESLEGLPDVLHQDTWSERGPARREVAPGQRGHRDRYGPWSRAPRPSAPVKVGEIKIEASATGGELLNLRERVFGLTRRPQARYRRDNRRFHPQLPGRLSLREQ